MPRVCVVKDCPSIENKKIKTTHHRFPRSDRDRAKKWLEKLDVRITVSEKSVICGLHFANEDFVDVRGHINLLNTAIPMEFKENGQKLLNKPIRRENILKVDKNPNIKSKEAKPKAKRGRKAKVKNEEPNEIEVKLEEFDIADKIESFNDFMNGMASSCKQQSWRDNWVVHQQPNGICFYRLTSDESFADVKFAYKILIKEDLKVGIFIGDYEGESSELNWILSNATLMFWTQLHRMLAHYQREPIIKLKSNTKYFIDKALEVLSKIDDPDVRRELVEPVMLQLSSASSKGEPVKIEDVFVKQELFDNAEDFPAVDEVAASSAFLNFGSVLKPEEDREWIDDDQKSNVSSMTMSAASEDDEKSIRSSPAPEDDHQSDHSELAWFDALQAKKQPRKKYKKRMKVEMVDCSVPNSDLAWWDALDRSKQPRKPHKPRVKTEAYNCEHCGKLFQTSMQYNGHVRNTHAGPFYCDICGAKLASRKSLRNHMIRRHTEPERFKCPECDLVMLPDSLRRHIRVTHRGEKPHPCPTCGKFFSSKTLVKQHLLTHIDMKTGLPKASEGTTRKCPKCGGNFRRRFDDHVASCSGTFNAKRPYVYPCLVCTRRFYTKTKCGNHMIDVHKWTIGNIEKFCFVCREEFDNIVCHYKNHRPLFKCTQCGKRFYSQKNLDHHMENHGSDEERPFSCDECFSTFKIKNHLQIHMKAMHTTERNFVCHICDKTFTFQTGLTIHLSNHSDVRKFACAFCPTRFKRLFSMKEHCMKIHSEENPYPCAHCGIKLKTLNEMKHHQQEEHGVSINVQKYHEEMK